MRRARPPSAQMSTMIVRPSGESERNCCSIWKLRFGTSGRRFTGSMRMGGLDGGGGGGEGGEGGGEGGEGGGRG